MKTVLEKQLAKIIGQGRCHRANTGKEDCACVQCSRYLMALELVKQRAAVTLLVRSSQNILSRLHDGYVPTFEQQELLERALFAFQDHEIAIPQESGQ